MWSVVCVDCVLCVCVGGCVGGGVYVHYFQAQTWFQQYDWHGVVENLWILLSQETPGKMGKRVL